MPSVITVQKYHCLHRDSSQSPVLYQRNPFDAGREGGATVYHWKQRSLLCCSWTSTELESRCYTVSSEALLNCQSVRFSKAFPNSGLLSQHTGIQAFKAQLWLRTGSAAAKNMCKGPCAKALGRSTLYGKTISKLPFLPVCQRLGQMFQWNPWFYQDSLEPDKGTASWHLLQMKVSTSSFYFNTWFCFWRVQINLPTSASHVLTLQVSPCLALLLLSLLPVLLQCRICLTFYSSDIMIPWNTNKITFHRNSVYIPVALFLRGFIFA